MKNEINLYDISHSVDNPVNGVTYSINPYDIICKHVYRDGTHISIEQITDAKTKLNTSSVLYKNLKRRHDKISIISSKSEDAIIHPTETELNAYAISGVPLSGITYSIDANNFICEHEFVYGVETNRKRLHMHGSLSFDIIRILKDRNVNIQEQHTKNYETCFKPTQNKKLLIC
ncbi:MAG: hypothetical protein WC979_00365 [Candidatus Pacearchaeota archaeon]|jgi:hypothetical protein|nr:hypothetical protein [Clostridia bacterium]